MIRVTALTSGQNAPASRFRVRPFIKPLRSFGIEVVEHYPFFENYLTRRVPPIGMLARIPGVLASRRGDITWLERALIPERQTLEFFTGGKRIFDVDDAIWMLRNSRFSERIAARCDAVIAGNDFIAEHYRNEGARVFVVPTSIDTELWRPRRKTENSHWTVGWIGTSSNLSYLYEVEEPIARFLSDYRDSELLIVCDKSPVFTNTTIADRVRYVKWSPDRDVELVQGMDVGLMPLSDTDWARGKCALKMLGYMAVGIPVIASPVGVNQKLFQQAAIGWPVVTQDDWYEALRQAFLDRALAGGFGVTGRQTVEAQYSIHSNVPLLAEVFKAVISA
jgi:glycosyltransferase involved in cell wall biosynthesis